MYRQHFSLREQPFTLTPDTGYFYEYSAHREALNVLLVSFRGGEGFVKVTGEVGTGKTLLCRMLLKQIGEDFVTAWIPNPTLTPTALHLSLARELGLECRRNMGQHAILEAINARLMEINGSGRRVLLLMDEAQALSDESLEALRLLTNLETEKSKLLQIVLFGQPELDERLARHSLRQLRQRISFSYELAPLDREAVEGYVSHRLTVAGYSGPALFTPSALTLLHRGSGGIPRLINVLSHKALLAAWGEGCRCVKKSHIKRAIEDSDLDDHRPRMLLRRAGCALAGLGMLYGGSAL